MYREIAYMDDVHLDSSDAGVSEVGVHGVVEISGLARMDEPDPALDDLHHG